MTNDLKKYASIGSAQKGKRKMLLRKYDLCEIRTDLCKITPQQLKSELIAIKRYKEKVNKDLLNKYPKELFKNIHKGIPKRRLSTIISIRPPIHIQEALDLIIAAIGAGAEYIDLDIEVARKIASTNFLQKNKKIKFIVSYHNYNSTPSFKKLQEIVRECISIGESLSHPSMVKSSVAKIAVTPKNMEEVSRVMQLYSNLCPIQNKRIIAIAMGELGIFTRIISLQSGAPLTYFRADEAVAEGQLSYKEFKDLQFPPPYYIIKSPTDTPEYSDCIVSSKSLAQRALLLAAYASGKSRLENFRYNFLPLDTLNALKFIKSTGAKGRESQKGDSSFLNINSKGFENWKEIEVVNCGESAFLARCVIALAALTGRKLRITGKGTLMKRDFSSSLKIIEENGGKVIAKEDSLKGKSLLPIFVERGVKGDEIKIEANSTSQDLSGYLMALPLRKNGGTIKVTNLVSTSYIDLTLNVMKTFGVTVQTKNYENKRIFSIDRGEKYTPATLYLDNDWSGAANLIVGCVLDSYKNEEREVLAVERMRLNSGQSDEYILDVLKKCGCKVIAKPVTFKLSDIYIYAKELKGFKADCTNSPDLIPILSILALFCEGRSEIKGVHRLINKESNRAAAILLELSRLQRYLNTLKVGEKSKQEENSCQKGKENCKEKFNTIDVKIKGDSFIIEGPLTIRGEEKEAIHSFSTHNDHRIAMALAVLFNCLTKKIKKCKGFGIDNKKCISKSFPLFLKYFQI